jgi:peptide-methionine (S)-S-oxide reductase
MAEPAQAQVAVFGGGCFWCTEAVFERLKGVLSVMPGYSGGRMSDPSYEEVCSGKTGHAEAIRIEFDPAKISYRDLLTVFFATHDPTTLNCQGHDVGTQYRSIILTTTPEQEREAKAFIEELNQSGTFATSIVTEVKPLEKFYEAEAYHHRYYERNSQQPYCQIVIDPKVSKLKERFHQLLVR